MVSFAQKPYRFPLLSHISLFFTPFPVFLFMPLSVNPCSLLLLLANHFLSFPAHLFTLLLPLLANPFLSFPAHLFTLLLLLLANTFLSFPPTLLGLSFPFFSVFSFLDYSKFAFKPFIIFGIICVLLPMHGTACAPTPDGSTIGQT
jgi:hypothetical protein